MTNDLMLAAAAQLGTITVAVWGLTEWIGSGRPGRKPLIAVGLGVALAMLAHLVGFLTALPDPVFPGSTYIAAGLAGLVCTVTAKLAHDGILMPIIEWKRGVPVPAPADTIVTAKTTVSTVTIPTVTTPPVTPPADGPGVP